MGLTIHYKLQMTNDNPANVRSVMDKLHQRAGKLDFEDISDVVKLEGQACQYEQYQDTDPLKWVTRNAYRINFEGNSEKLEAPEYLIAFDTYPAEGAESASFGLARYGSDQPNGQHTPVWTWQAFCKTQYASNPKYGGIKNFLKAHLGIVSMLDHAHELGVLEKVVDESEYWEHRDPKKLIGEIGQWNQMIARYYGKIKDLYGDMIIDAPISEFPNFEHLEADDHYKKGQDSDAKDSD